jgi:hypothetical protein
VYRNILLGLGLGMSMAAGAAVGFVIYLPATTYGFLPEEHALNLVLGVSVTTACGGLIWKLAELALKQRSS